MSLFEELSAEVDSRRRCSVCDWYAQLSDEPGPDGELSDKAAFDAHIAQRKPLSVLFRVCERRGLPVKYAHFNRHCNECRA